MISSLPMENSSPNESGFFEKKKPLSNAQLFMMLSLFSWGMLFGTLILSLMLARTRSAGQWPPTGITPLDPFLPTVSTAILLLSSFFLHRGYKFYLRQEQEKFHSFWGLACFTGILFVLMQAITLTQWWQTGTTHRDHLYTSCLYVFIILHALHVLMGLSGLLYKFYKPVDGQSLQLWGWFWHFIDVVWIVSFPILLF